MYGQAYWRKPQPPAKIVISGGGDGALQDYLRILTNSTASELYNKLKTLVHTSEIEEIEKEIQYAEFQAQRAYAWSTEQFDHDILHRLHLAHAGQAAALLAKIGNNGKIQALIPNHHFDIALLHKCDHFSNCYPLNHFLVLFVSEYLRQHQQKNTIRQNAKLVSVQSASPPHTCSNHSTQCHGKLHDVAYNTGVDCLERNAQPAISMKADVIIIRHGIQSSTGQKQKKAKPRQLLPLHIP